jgi:hypothetical protein
MSQSTELRAAIDANRAFYRALAEGDFEAMDALWATTAPVLCAHPGAAVLHGRHRVMESWRGILSAPPPIRESSVQVALVRGLAIVSCLEHIGDGTLAASNVFVWEDGAWRLVHHHAGPLDRLEPEAGTAGGGHLH